MKHEARKILIQYMQRWSLIPDGDCFYTRSGLLQPVRFEDVPAMLKIPMEAEEKRGSLLMVWWDGCGAARVLNYDEQVLLLERLSGARPSLAEIAKNGQDDEASCIICSVAAKLHSRGKRPLPALIHLADWFSDLWPAANKYGSVFDECARIAKDLLNSPQEIVVLHGDLHHENVLHSRIHGWVAIDPKGLAGERTFDYANIFCNPNEEIALTPGRLSRQLNVISKEASLDPKRLLQWIAAWAGLSAVWSITEGEDAKVALEIAELAIAGLRK